MSGHRVLARGRWWRCRRTTSVLSARWGRRTSEAIAARPRRRLRLVHVAHRDVLGEVVPGEQGRAVEPVGAGPPALHVRRGEQLLPHLGQRIDQVGQRHPVRARRARTAPEGVLDRPLHPLAVGVLGEEQPRRRASSAPAPRCRSRYLRNASASGSSRPPGGRGLADEEARTACRPGTWRRPAGRSTDAHHVVAVPVAGLAEDRLLAVVVQRAG